MTGRRIGHLPGLIMDLRRKKYEIQVAFNSDPQEVIDHIIQNISLRVENLLFRSFVGAITLNGKKNRGIDHLKGSFNALI